jgi:hypothetical protein
MTILICVSLAHAEVVDALITEAVRDSDGTQCTRWSGCYTDGSRFGVLWGEPAASLFRLPEDEELEVVERTDEWAEVPAPVTEQEEGI